MRIALLVGLLASAFAKPALGKVFRYTDEGGVVHLTNVRPTGSQTHNKWKVVAEWGPGKASVQRGDCNRCDTVPATDGSPERFYRYDSYIQEAARLFYIPEALIRAVIKVESDYDPRVVSYVGARGLMQLMPTAAREMDVLDVHDARQNILGGTKYLRRLANRFQGDLVLTIAAYQAGPGAVGKYGTIPPYRNTQRYTRKVLKYYYDYKNGKR